MVPDRPASVGAVDLDPRRLVRRGRVVLDQRSDRVADIDAVPTVARYEVVDHVGAPAGAGDAIQSVRGDSVGRDDGAVADDADADGRVAGRGDLLDAVRVGIADGHPVPELLESSVADADVVVALVADAEPDALTVDRVAPEIDRDVRRVDHEAVPRAVREVVLDLERM